jgi:Lhr-like helicase
LGALADALRRGDDTRFQRVLEKHGSLDRIALRIFSDDASLLASLLLQVATAYGEASVYHPVRQLAAINPERTPRLESFARTQFSRRRGILWTSQRDGLGRLIQESSFALCTPTGSGKTLVANLALVKELLLHQGASLDPLALYLVPSRALAGEVEAKLTGELGHDLIVTGLYGGADWGVTDYWLNANRPTVLVATVEKADALMRYLGPLLLRRLRLLIIDEAHQVVQEDDDRTQADFAEHSNRSIRLESFLSRLLAQSPDIVRIALTAVAGGAAFPVARWIEGRDGAEPVGTHYRSTRQIIGVLETDPDSAGRMLL